MTSSLAKSDLVIPPACRSIVDGALALLPESRMARRLSAQTRRLHEAVHRQHLYQRTHEDNRPEHEVVVLAHFIEIALGSGGEGPSSRRPMSESDLRVGMAVCLLHDTCFIPRVTEGDIARAASPAEADRLRATKALQRPHHMAGSARNAKNLLLRLSSPGSLGHSMLSQDEIRRAVGIIALHDSWKLGFAWPPSSDWLAVCFVEADGLWPLSETGPLADLQRTHGPDYAPTKQELRGQAEENQRTQLMAYRMNFDPTTEVFQDEETIIRTRTGFRILQRYRELWRLQSGR